MAAAGLLAAGNENEDGATDDDALPAQLIGIGVAGALPGYLQPLPNAPCPDLAYASNSGGNSICALPPGIIAAGSSASTEGVAKACSPRSRATGAWQRRGATTP